MESERRLIFISCHISKYILFHNCLWVTLRYSPMFFGVIVLYRRNNSRYKTTGLNWSNMDQISLISFLWKLLLLHRLFYTLDFPHWCLLIWSSPSVTWCVIWYSILIAIIHTFFVVCVKSWWLAGQLCIVSTTKGIVKYSSSNKPRPIFFP